MANEFVKAGEATPEVLELANEAFNKVTFFVALSVVLTRVETINAVLPALYELTGNQAFIST